jgi:hypothetical protein
MATVVMHVSVLCNSMSAITPNKYWNRLCYFFLFIFRPYYNRSIPSCVQYLLSDSVSHYWIQCIFCVYFSLVTGIIENTSTEFHCATYSHCRTYKLIKYIMLFQCYVIQCLHSSITPNKYWNLLYYFFLFIVCPYYNRSIPSYVLYLLFRFPLLDTVFNILYNTLYILCLF